MGSENQNGFFNFSDFRNKFLTILVFDDSVYYIDPKKLSGYCKTSSQRYFNSLFCESIKYGVRKSKWVF